MHSTSLLFYALTICCAIAPLRADCSNKSSVTVIESANLNWGFLNPLRGDKSPGAANIWGDRTKNTASGMLVRFNTGFSSPPHIHNVSYRGIVIYGMLHNDDPNAENMWMPTGSFWTQPAGEVHIIPIHLGMCSAQWELKRV